MANWPRVVICDPNGDTASVGRWGVTPLIEEEYGSSIVLHSNTDADTIHRVTIVAVAFPSGSNGTVEIHWKRGTNPAVRLLVYTPSASGGCVLDLPVILESGDSIIADVVRTSGSAPSWNGLVTYESVRV